LISSKRSARDGVLAPLVPWYGLGMRSVAAPLGPSGLACLVLSLAACADNRTESSDGASQGDGSTAGADGSLADGARLDGALPDGLLPDGALPDGGWGTLPGGGCAPVRCQAHTYQCANCLDDDGDGLTDWQDPDCLGPCDNSEQGYDLGIPGGGSAPCRLDCYFDQDTGSGNDTCRWDHRCDPREPQAPRCADRSPPPPSAECPAMQPSTCLAFCGPLVPNGCDCFGCCELPAGSGRTVFLGSEPRNGAPRCSPATATNPDSCRLCTQVTACLNRCERCEVCLGRPRPPADCFVPQPPPSDAGPAGATRDAPAPGDGGVTNPGQCPASLLPCGLPGQGPCPPDFYCITGCCLRGPS
jgi:hypothetical protein